MLRPPGPGGINAARATRDQEPWTFGPEIEAICKRYLRLRYELLPYLYTQFHRAATDGTPVLRPLALAYPVDPETWPIADQALVGPDLLVCPISRPGVVRRARTVSARSGRRCRR